MLPEYNSFNKWHVNIKQEFETSFMSDTVPFLPPHLEGQSSWLSKTTSARFLGHPLVWSAFTALFILLGYLWLQYYARPLSVNIEQSHADNKLIGGANTGNWNPQIYQPTQTEESMPITRQADEIRAQKYRTIIDQENQIQPLLAAARKQLDDRHYTEPSQENAWHSYQVVLTIDPSNQVAQSGQAQIIQILEENASYAFEEKHYEEAERWLIQLDEVRANHPFQDDLRKRIAEQIKAELAEAEAKRQIEKRFQLLQDALSDAKAALEADPPQLRAAYDLFQRALTLDETNLRASAGLDEIYRKRIDMAKLAIAKGDYVEAQAQIDRLQKIGVEDQRTDRLKAALKSAQTREMATQNRVRRSPLPNQTSSGTRILNGSNNMVPGINRPGSKPRVLEQDDKYAQLLKGIDAYYAGDYDNAFKLLHPLAEEGVARAQFRLGIMYSQGRTVIENNDLARQWISQALPTVIRAAQNNEAWAQTDLGTAYELGIGMDKNTKMAASWYQKAADQGYAGAQTNLGVLYGSGVGLRYDRQRAIYWLKLAAEQGDKIAQDNLRILNAR